MICVIYCLQFSPQNKLHIKVSVMVSRKYIPTSQAIQELQKTKIHQWILIYLCVSQLQKLLINKLNIGTLHAIHVMKNKLENNGWCKCLKQSFICVLKKTWSEKLLEPAYQWNYFLINLNVEHLQFYLKILPHRCSSKNSSELPNQIFPRFSANGSVESDSLV